MQSFVDQKDFTDHRESYFWEPSRERTTASKKPQEEIPVSDLKSQKLKATPSQVRPFNPEDHGPNRKTFTGLTESQTRKAKNHRKKAEESAKKESEKKKQRPMP